ncbi:hypothetical protein BC833DRAFT_657975 [Globomyces pollinis-pini]|nr:hypothetical protein BC833DRAFT_657975 [Globomyces pollinis-pini]
MLCPPGLRIVARFTLLIANKSNNMDLPINIALKVGLTFEVDDIPLTDTEILVGTIIQETSHVRHRSEFIKDMQEQSDQNLANHQLKAKKIQESIVPTLNPVISKQNQDELQLYRKLLVEIEDIERLLRAQVTKAQVAYKLFKDTLHSAIHEYGESILNNLINNETLFDTGILEHDSP